MGILVNGTCHADENAGRILLQASYPVVSSISPSGDLLSWQLKYEDPDGWSGQQWLWVKTVNGLYQEHVFTSDLEVFCDPVQSVQDGAALGWGVSLCFLAAFAFVLFRRASV